jgi:hypothetical protein
MPHRAPHPSDASVALPFPLATGFAATAVLTAEDVAAVLTADTRADLLENLGIRDQDREELGTAIPAVLDDAELLAEVTTTANALRARAGLDVTPAPLGEWKKRHDELQQRVLPGEGLLAVLAHVVSTDTVRSWHTARGISSDDSWAVLADLGQQMRVHRRGTGRLGLHQVSWTAMNWSGVLFHLGRLQFDLHRRGESSPARRWTIGTHIPATGPLTPDVVEESLQAATAFFTTHFPDLAFGREEDAPAFGHEFVCHSWLMNPELIEFLGADSNIGAFVSRWEIVATSPGNDSAAFFVFGARPPYDPASFPRRTRLEREVADRLADGRGWLDGKGMLLR